MNSQLLDIWYRALRAELGIRVHTEDARRLKSRLYKVRAEANDPDLETLSLRTSPEDPAHEIWITKGGRANGQSR